MTLVLAHGLILRETHCLTIKGTPTSGLRNPGGLFLDGAGNGQPGSDYVTSLTKSNLVGPASQRPIAAVVEVRAKSVNVRVETTNHKHAK